ncbi:TIGR03752 family integrating conjugative element protein [Nitrogeniibacter aestuarii]|uniref:TIGR03752 family integrating conjugative element protein n=1 Tax=Nitrogeniibacter aestuarii TaxID=2815343 RepID=UPI001E2DA8C3|nr:TIGR03752 family integrating conjugative element protein [Nitrogeniibacter aestuarii]
MDFKTNKLIPLVVVSLLVTVVIVYSTRSGDEGVVSAGPEMETIPLPQADTGADADTPVETLKTVVGGFRRLEERLGLLEDENQRLRRENADAKAMETRLSDQIRRDQERGMGRVEAQLRADAERERQLSRQITGVESESTGRGNGSASASLADESAQVILPAGYNMTRSPDGALAIGRTLPQSSLLPGRNGGRASKKLDIKPDVPFYTINENATLLGAKAMTSIVGRVPVDGEVSDPMEFKAILGPENLAANGHYLPRNLAGVIVSGIAIGDMTLSCSQGHIISMTFVFADGSIQTVSERGDDGRGAGVAGKSTPDRLGYISDSRGNPCIPGKFVTNAPAYLTDMVALKSLSIAGKAYATAQTTTLYGAATGTTATAVTGDKGKYVLGEAASAGIDEVTDWITRRMEDSFDAVVTTAGSDVVVHITKEIPIDKKGDARRIDYGRADVAANAQRGQFHGMH